MAWHQTQPSEMKRVSRSSRSDFPCSKEGCIFPEKAPLTRVRLNAGSGPMHYNSFFSSDNLLENNLACRSRRAAAKKNVCPIYKIKRKVLEVAYTENATAAHNVKMGDFF